MKGVNLDSLTAVEVSELLGVTDRAVRKWIETKNLPHNAGPGVKTFKWKDVLAWHNDKVREEVGTVGTAPPRRASLAVLGGQNTTPDVPETCDEAFTRKTIAEADLKELQLARQRSQVVSIDLLERVLSAGNLATKTQILSVPSRLAIQMLGLDDHAKAFRILNDEMHQLLTNLANIDDIREASNMEDKEGEDDK